MSEPKSPNPSYKTLGTHLRFIREQSNESVAEVSGAVEIDEKSLLQIEAGQRRPAEEILLLLISHFNMQDHEAVQLWELAGYDSEIPDRIRPATDASQTKAMVMLLAVDMRTMYTDNVDVTCTGAGVTITFNQTSLQSRPTSVARLGMSYDQAEQVIMTLQQALLKAKYLKGPKALPPNAAHKSDDSPTA